MAKIGVGVPTYNRSSYLRETLQCLKAQTGGDFTVLVMDNASTDDTREVFDETVGDDSRFAYHRNAENIGALNNFHAVLQTLETEYFLWRADDDLSADDYLAGLADALDADPRADLAVSPFRRKKLDVSPHRAEKVFPLPEFPHGPGVERARFALCNSHATWIYGMWRRNALLRNLELSRDYPLAWASDHALVFPTLVTGAVTQCQSTWFLQRFLGSVWYKTSPAEQMEARRRYIAYAQSVIGELHVEEASSPEFRAALETHYDRCLGGLWRLRRRLLKQRLKEAIGLGST